MAFEAEGRRWAISTPHALATDAGARTFEAGGNAIDAALAAATTIAVSAPHMCGVGGDLFALVQIEDGRTMAVNASGPAPSGLDVERLRERYGEGMPERGPDSVTLPGAVDGWAALHGLGARLPWAAAFEPAIAAATDGTEVSSDLAETLAWDPALREDPGMAALWFDGDRPRGAGERVRQPALGETLRVLADDGPHAFSRGELGLRYAEGLRALGVPIADGDLRPQRAQVLPPLSARYRDLHVSVAPPNSQGFVLLELLMLVERLGIRPDPLGDDAGRLALAIGATSADRDEHLADAEAMLVHPHTLLDEGHLAGLADEVREATAGAGAPGSLPSPARGDTIALVTADASGTAVSLIQSLYSGFGSGLLEPSTGIVAHNRGACFTLRAGHANEPAPGKRPAHTLLPVTVHRRGELVAVAGTMGGHAQPQIDAAVLMRAFDLGMTPAEAVAASRWLAWGMDRPGSTRVAAVEAGVPDAARESLRAVGYALAATTSPHDAGHAHLLVAGADGFVVGSDPRAEGSALAG